MNDQELVEAGYCIQVITKDEERRCLEFGAEVISLHDESIAALFIPQINLQIFFMMMLLLIFMIIKENGLFKNDFFNTQDVNFNMALLFL